MQNPFLLKNIKNQGYSHILFDSAEQKKQYCRGESKNAPPQTAAQAKEPFRKPVSPAEQYKTEQHRPPFRPQEKFSAPVPPQKTIPAPAQQPQNPSPQTPDVLPLEKWPADWKHAHRRCQLPSERPRLLSRQIVWTYAGLEYDLFTDSPNAKRRELIKNIITTLALPKGTHIFLPYRLMDKNGNSELAEHQGFSFFWSAVDLIRPRVLVVFGPKSAEELNLPPMLPTQKLTVRPFTVYALDNIMLYTENETENKIMMNFLTDNLKIFS